MNLGQLVSGHNNKARIRASTELQTFALIVTAEPYHAVSEPGNAVVLETDVAPRDLSTATTVALDGTATWPRDGWHPSRCVR